MRFKLLEALHLLLLCSPFPNANGRLKAVWKRGEAMILLLQAFL